MIHRLSLVPLFAVMFMGQGAFAQNATVSPVFVDVSGGLRHTCALEADGALTCAQSSDANRLVPPENIPALSDVEAGTVHACGLTLSGTTVCWGDNDFGQLNVPDSAQFSLIKAGGSHTCGITAFGSVECWGLNDLNQATPPEESLINPDTQEPVVFMDLALTENISCGLDTDGYIHCWGDGDFNYRSATSLADEDAGASVVKLAIDRRYARWTRCGLLSDSRIECEVDSFVFDDEYKDIAGTDLLICGLTLNGDLDCKGNMFADEDPDIVAQIADINAGEPLVSINGSVALCGITVSGAVRCLDPYNAYFPVPLPGEFLPTLLPATDFRATVYGDTTVELFWQNNNDYRPWEVAYIEIHRDGELLAQTTQASSYLDDSLEPGRDYSYRLRYIPFSGAPSEFSAPLVVNSQQQGGGGLPYTPMERPNEPKNLQALVYGPTLLELIWDRPQNVTLGFEIRRDGQFLAYASGTSLMDRSVEAGNNYVYEVISVDGDGDIYGVAMTRAEVQ